MNMENRKNIESKPTLFEVDGHPVIDSKIIDAGDTVSFSFVIKADKALTPADINFSKLINDDGGLKILKDKKWINEQGKFLVPLDQKGECVKKGHGEYMLNFILTPENKEYN